MKGAAGEQYPKNQNYNPEHLYSRFLGRTDVYYNQFLKNEKAQTAEIAAMSSLSQIILSRTDYDFCKKRRLANFAFLHRILSKYNLFEIDLRSVGIPYMYPFLPEKRIDRTKFYKDRLFISTLWTDVLLRGMKGFGEEEYLSAGMLPLPIDQQYGLREMRIIADYLKKLL